MYRIHLYLSIVDLILILTSRSISYTSDFFSILCAVVFPICAVSNYDLTELYGKNIALTIIMSIQPNSSFRMGTISRGPVYRSFTPGTIKNQRGLFDHKSRAESRILILRLMETPHNGLSCRPSRKTKKNNQPTNPSDALTLIFANSIDPYHETPLFWSMEWPKFKAWWVHFRNPGVHGLYT